MRSSPRKTNSMLVKVVTFLVLAGDKYHGGSSSLGVAGRVFTLHKTAKKQDPEHVAAGGRGAEAEQGKTEDKQDSHDALSGGSEQENKSSSGSILGWFGERTPVVVKDCSELDWTISRVGFYLRWHKPAPIFTKYGRIPKNARKCEAAVDSEGEKCYGWTYSSFPTGRFFRCRKDGDQKGMEAKARKVPASCWSWGFFHDASPYC